MANNVSSPITANLHYSCDFSSRRIPSQVVARESFEEKLARFLTPENVQAFGQSNDLKTGDLVQLQKPSECGIYFYEGVKNGKPDFIEDFLVILKNEDGCYNYVASSRESKNSGRYQRFAKRVLTSQTYLVKKNYGRYELELIFDKDEWLDSEKALQAFAKVAEAKALIWYNSEPQLAECMLHLSNKVVEIRAARVVDCEEWSGAKKRIVMSLNSGKIWVLDAEQCSIKGDVSGKNLIMTNFIGLKKVSAKGDYIRVS